MLGRTYEAQNCSAARTLEAVGERWSLLIVRDALFRGATRFKEFERNLGIAPNVLASRLQSFIRDGIMEMPATPHQGHQPPSYELTEKGRDLAAVIVALTTWGDRWAAPNGAPIEFEHIDCGGPLFQEITCSACHRVVPNKHVATRPGPGAVATQKPRRQTVRPAR